MKKAQLTKEEQQEVDFTLNHWDNFEYYCGACDNYKTDNCPFKDIVTPMTMYRKEDGGLGCNNFWD